jgi:AraC-like DNA-binding protein
MNNSMQANKELQLTEKDFTLALRNGHHLEEGGVKSFRLKYIRNWPELAREVKWSASMLAKKCGVSVRTLERYFLKEFDKCPRIWLAEQRQLQAVELFQTGATAKEIAAYLGYKHATHFSRNFRQKNNGHCFSTMSAKIQ